MRSYKRLIEISGENIETWSFLFTGIASGFVGGGLFVVDVDFLFFCCFETVFHCVTLTWLIGLELPV